MLLEYRVLDLTSDSRTETFIECFDCYSVLFHTINIQLQAPQPYRSHREDLAHTVLNSNGKLLAQPQCYLQNDKTKSQ